MKAFILAAGLGTRLRPLTDSLPKAMAPVAPDLPLLEHHIQHLKAFGIREFVINLHHLPEKITDRFGDGSRFGVAIEYSDETGGLLDTGGAIRKAAPLLGDEFLVVYGDQLHFEHIGALIDVYRQSGAAAALLVKRSDHPANGDVVDLAQETGGRIVQWHARPHAIAALSGTLYLNAGVYVLSSAVVSRIPPGRPVSLDREVLPAMLADGALLYGVPAAGDILDIGTPEKLAYAQAWFARHPARQRRALFLDRDGVIIHALPRGEYLTDWSQSSLVDGIQSLVSSARSAGYLTVVVTNQPQVSRGLLSEEKLRSIHDRMADALDRQVDAIYYCPHTDGDCCDCRKPKDGMLVRGGRDFSIALDRSIFVGDSDRDVTAGASAGCRTVFVRNAFNAAEGARCSPGFVVNNLTEILELL
jgi:D-glycero-D-manno-heptose 1,7-bisphosphate phosphatase